jgi:hypothetical protein
LGSTEVKVLYNNASNLDDAVNGELVTWTDRFGQVRKSLAGIELDFANFLLASGYEFIGDYDDAGELTFTRPNQLMSKDGEYWRPGPSLSLPYTTVNNWAIDQPKFVSTGDASLRSALAASNGTTYIGFGNRTLFQKLGEHVSVKDAPFNAVGDGVADDTAAIQAFMDYLAASTESGLTTSGALSAAYSGTSPQGFFPKGTYRVTEAINVGAYIELIGESAIIKQDDVNADIFVVDLYQFKMSGMQFVGGRQQLVFSNANINSSMFEVDHCQFFLSRHFAIKTAATGGTWTHLSCKGKFNNCRFIACHQVIDNCCDNMIFEDPWVQPELPNLSASTAVFNNRGAYPTDPNAQTRLNFIRGFYIPAVGTYGVDRPANLRWVDNWGSFISQDARFGGEFGGMSIVWHHALPDMAFPWNTTEVTIRGGLAFCGPSDDPTACIVGLQGQVPQRMNIGGFSGMVSSPIVRNLSSTDLPAYFSSFQGTSGRVATEYFKFKIDDIITDVRLYSPLRPMLPDELYKYLIPGRNTRVLRVNKGLLNGSVDNIVDFSTTTEFDSVSGAFVPATPTRLIMPNGCSKMRIEVDIVIDSTDNLAKTFSAQIENSAGNRWKGIAQNFGINPYGDNIHFTTDVYGPPGTYWQLNIIHNGTTTRNMVSCQVVMTPLDMII